jgi:hypothetical protein
MNFIVRERPFALPRGRENDRFYLRVRLHLGVALAGRRIFFVLFFLFSI